MGKKYGFSFSWKRALGISSVRAKLARQIGIPTTRSGMQREVGRTMGCAIPSIVFLLSATVVFVFGWIEL